uniref:Uncharacterized protein n=1 Tax=Setaria viridis TaxID=4556 RepID=A0A4U6VFW6_SETVI|nr:hypothetical protein SEVIR_3G248250v2 [Setaria viridis]
MSKATARSGVMSVCESGISSSGRGSCSSQRANQLGSSSLMAAAPPLLCSPRRAILAAHSTRRRGGGGDSSSTSRLDSTPAEGRKRPRREGGSRGRRGYFEVDLSSSKLSHPSSSLSLFLCVCLGLFSPPAAATAAVP